MEDQQPTLSCAAATDSTPGEETTRDEDLFRTEEVVIEEMAIDGICGVY